MLKYRMNIAVCVTFSVSEKNQGLGVSCRQVKKPSFKWEVAR